MEIIYILMPDTGRLKKAYCMETRILINNNISGLDERIKDISGQISDCPDGRLIITKNNGKRVMMHITGKEQVHPCEMRRRTWANRGP